MLESMGVSPFHFLQRTGFFDTAFFDFGNFPKVYLNLRPREPQA